MQRVFRWVADRPLAVLAVAPVLPALCLVLALATTHRPDFQDPHMGFESRGTTLAERNIAWDNLLKATRPSGALVANPKEWEPPPEYGTFVINETILAAPEETRPNTSDTFCEDEWRCLETHELADLEEHGHMHLAPDGFFCTELSPAYAHVVFSQDSLGNSDLLTTHSLRSMCSIEAASLRGSPGFESLCQTVRPDGPCCPSWSIGNYAAMMHNRTSCLQLTDEDVNSTVDLLRYCAPFYHTLRLSPECGWSGESNIEAESGAFSCRNVPANCTRHNAVYFILHYLTDYRFLPPEGGDSKLTYAASFLPIAKSTAALHWYRQVEQRPLSDGVTRIVAMDLGLKSALFSDCLLRDTILVGVAATAVLLSMWVYTASLLVTAATMVSVASSLAVSYFVYTVVLRIRFFPFMNLLAAVVSVGVGCDGTFVYCKAWECAKAEKNSGTLTKVVSDAVKMAAPSLFVTSVTTTAAFYASYVGHVTAIRCFGIFAGTAILANFALTMAMVPAAVVASEKWCQRAAFARLTVLHHTASSFGKSLVENTLVPLIVRLRYVWIALFGTAAIFGALAVLYRPRLQLPDSADFQLFHSEHPFEVYDLGLKDWFRFERVRHDDNVEKLPIRFVFGATPVDNGNHLDPRSRGSLILDPSFDVSQPESQQWLLEFCRSLQEQPFYEAPIGPLLPNCFIETFKSWMVRRCKDPINDIDRSPCCESTPFPYPAQVFNQCIADAVRSLYETPAEFFIPGVAGPKFDREGAVRSVVVEYDSNVTFSHSFPDMQRFYVAVESWARQRIKEAPPGMRNGWFTSHLEFYDLQRSLADDTVKAILVALFVSLFVLFVTTLNLLVSLYAVVTVASTIFVAVGTLVVLGWKLNVVESVAVTAAIGLAADFPLHYAMAYKMAAGDRQTRVGQAVAKMAAPVTMAAVTSVMAGAFMLLSEVLAYRRIGTFILVLMGASWSFSTFFLAAILAAAGPENTFGQLRCRVPKCRVPKCLRRSGSPTRAADKTVYSVVLSESNLSTSSVTCPQSHELEPLTSGVARPRSVSLTNQRSVLSTHGRKISLPTPGLDGGADSAMVGSDTTIVMSDELDSLEASQQVLVA